MTGLCHPRHSPVFAIGHFPPMFNIFYWVYYGLFSKFAIIPYEFTLSQL